MAKKIWQRLSNGIIFDISFRRLFVDDIKTLTNDQINALECGDVVVKVDETGKHNYIVSYKKDDTGICLTYTDATYVETVSYDLTDGNWVFNSVDSTSLE